jgi:hypothetical protein
MGKEFRDCISVAPESWSRFEGCVVGVSVAVVAFGSRTARPQAAGTCRYHLPFNGADETLSYCPGEEPGGGQAATGSGWKR